MTTYRPASEVRRIAEDLIPKYHADLADVRIDYVFRDAAAKSRGGTVWGKARKIGGLNAYLASIESDVSDVVDVEDFFVIEIAEDIWATLDTKQRVALVDHELCHFGIDYDEKRDEAKLVMRAHDVEEFRDIVERHGLWAEPLTSMAKAMTQQQLDLYDDGDGE